MSVSSSRTTSAWSPRSRRGGRHVRRPRRRARPAPSSFARPRIPTPRASCAASRRSASCARGEDRPAAAARRSEGMVPDLLHLPHGLQVRRPLPGRDDACRDEEPDARRGRRGERSRCVALLPSPRQVRPRSTEIALIELGKPRDASRTRSQLARRAARRGEKPGQVLPGRPRLLRQADASCARSTASSFDVRRGETLGLVGESRLRQVHARAHSSCASSSPPSGASSSTARTSCRCPPRAAPAAPADADHLPGSRTRRSTRA